MTTLTITLNAICAGGNHLTFGITGAATATQIADLSDITAPLTAEDAQALVRIVGRMAKAGRTVAQAKTLLQAGVSITI